MKVISFLGSMLLLAIATIDAYTIYQSVNQGDVAMVVQSDIHSVILEFTLPALVKESKILPEFGPGVAFSIPGHEDYRFVPGTPHVPAIQKMVQVPNTGKVILSVLSEETTALGANVVVPYQKLPTHNGETFPYIIKSRVYRASQLYPSSSAELRGVEILRDIRFARVSFNPVRVNPVTGRTIMVTRAVVKLTFTEEKGTDEFHRVYTGLTKGFFPMYKEVLNLNRNCLKGSRQDDVPCYVFLGPTENLKAVQDLINWKKRKGYDVNVAHMDSVGSTGTEVDDWIRNAYENWDNPPLYIFIIGDENDVPTMQTGSYESDNKLGVIGSGNIPSIHIGRITPKNGNLDNLTYQAWKILKHENEPEIGTWLTKGETWGCQNPDGSGTANTWRDILEGGGLGVNVELEASGGATGATLIGHFNDGIVTFGYKGHGSPTSMSSCGISVNTLTSNIDNGTKFTWINNIGCNCSHFSGRYCIAEAWMCEGSIQDPKGCLGMFSFTVSSSVGGSDRMLSGIYQAILGDEPELWHVGAAATYGKTQGGTSSDIDGGMLWGCPELVLHTVSPLPELQADVDLQTKGSVTLTVTDGSSPVEGALVGVVNRDDYEHYGAGYTDASGKITLGIPNSNTVVYITATYRNHKPFMYEGATGIDANGHYVSSFFVSDVVYSAALGAVVANYSLPATSAVTLDVFATNGSLVYTGTMKDVEPGFHTLSWHGMTNNNRYVSNGMYLFRITTGFGTRMSTCTFIR